jgi:hypothetical protein
VGTTVGNWLNGTKRQMPMAMAEGDRPLVRAVIDLHFGL